MALPKAAGLLLAPILASSCASVERAPTHAFADYQRLYLTTPSHSDGYAMMGESEEASPVEAVRRAVVALRYELIEEGFEVVAEDGEADAVLELTIGGIGDHGEAERAFVALRDADDGRLLAVFTAHDRMAGRSMPTVEKLLAPLVEAIGEMVRPPVPPGGP